MFAIIIACHGHLAYELMQSSFIIFGEQEMVYALDYVADETPTDLEEKFTAVLDQLPSKTEVLILTDLYGGQPFMTARKFVLQNSKRYHLLAGVNLAMLLESYGNRQEVEVDYLEEIGREGVEAYRGEEDV